MSVKDTTVDEGETAMFTVELSGKVSKEVTFTYRTAEEMPPSADEDVDYTRADDDRTIMPGETTTTITVETSDDELAEASERFTLTVSNLRLENTEVTDADGISFGDASATATITDDALTATIEGPASVNEGEDAVYTVSVTGGGGDEQVTVTWSTEGSSATSDDFSPTTGTLTLGGKK